MNLVGPVGITASLMLIVVTIVLGGPLPVFINIPSFILLAGIALGMQLTALGASRFTQTFRSFSVLVRNVPAALLDAADAQILRALARHLYAAGVIGTFIGLIQMLTNFDDPAQLGPAIAISLLTIFYALILSECIVRPAANRIDYLLEMQAAVVSGLVEEE